MRKRIRTTILVLVILLFLPVSLAIAQGTGNSVYLPVIYNQPPPTPIPTPTAPPLPAGDNAVCNASGSAQICAWVSSGKPVAGSSVTVYGRLLINNVGQPGQYMLTYWHYKTTTSGCSAPTDDSGIAACEKNTGTATSGYKVNIDVTIGEYSATTWFTPQ